MINNPQYTLQDYVEKSIKLNRSISAKAGNLRRDRYFLSMLAYYTYFSGNMELSLKLLEDAIYGVERVIDLKLYILWMRGMIHAGSGKYDDLISTIREVRNTLDKAENTGYFESERFPFFSILFLTDYMHDVIDDDLLFRERK